MCTLPQIVGNGHMVLNTLCFCYGIAFDCWVNAFFPLPKNRAYVARLTYMYMYINSLILHYKPPEHALLLYKQNRALYNMSLYSIATDCVCLCVRITLLPFSMYTTLFWPVS